VLYDITRTVQSELAVWPGDTPYTVAPMLRIADGAAVNLTTLHLSAHTGTHADAYHHYEQGGAHPAAMPLDAYVGRARVCSVSKGSGALLPSDFAEGALVGIERLLIHSHVSEMADDVFPTAFPYLSVELISYLAGQGTKLVGLDSPSVDAFDSKDLPCHHAIYARGMVNLETLLLRGVPDGDYYLTALPLKLDLACGSPVRAILQDNLEFST
jgi:arylformamidase